MAPVSGSTSNASIAGGSSRCPILAMNRPSNAPFKPVISAIGIAIRMQIAPSVASRNAATAANISEATARVSILDAA